MRDHRSRSRGAKGYPAGRGYALVTGVGTVNAAQFVGELAAG